MIKLQRENISRLIEKISRRTSTENLIAFVADNFGMLNACQEVVNLAEETPATEERAWFEQRCRDFRVVPQVVRSECERLSSIFQPGLDQGEQYRLLGLTPLASINEVKSAYRKLSFRYHPDSSAADTNGNDNTEKFIAICRAYKKITQAQEKLQGSADQVETPSWQPELRSRNPRLRLRKRKAIFLIAAVAMGLLVISFSATRHYRHKAMIKSLGHSSQPVAAKSRPQIPVPSPQVSASAAPETSTVLSLSGKPESVKVAASVSSSIPIEVAAVFPSSAAVPSPGKSVVLVPAATSAAARLPASLTPEKTVKPAAVSSVPAMGDSVTPKKPVKVAARAVAKPLSVKKEPHPPSLQKPVKKVPMSLRRHKISKAKLAKPEKPAVRAQVPQAPVKYVPRKKVSRPEIVRKAKSTASAPVTKTREITPPKSMQVYHAPLTKPRLESVKRAAVIPSSVIAVAPIRTPRPLLPSPTAPVLLPLQERVDTFLSVYTNTYARLDFNAFASLFTADAKENNIPFKLRTTKYHNLFARLQKVSYTIKSDSLRVENHLVHVSGHFHAKLSFRDGHELNLHGPTSLLLREDSGHHFKVRNLTYTLK